MKGPEYLKGAQVAYLQATMPAKCTELEQRLGLSAGAIKPPASYTVTDQPDLTKIVYPWLSAEVLQLLSVADVDQAADDSLTFSARYATRVYVAVRKDKRIATGVDVPGAEQDRDRLVLAVMELLLTRPSLTTSDCRVVQPSLAAGFRAVEQDMQGRPVSQGFVGCDVVVDEQLAIAPLSPAPTTVAVTTAPLTP